MPPMVSVFGSSVCAPSDPLYEEARRFGALLGEGGADVACGGYGGVMEGVARGVTAAGGRAIGYTVAGWVGRRPNPFLTTVQPCADLYERLRHLIEPSDAFVALDGGIGTLAEVCLAWNHLFMALIDPRPLVVVGAPWARVVRGLAAELEVTDQHLRDVSCCPGIDAAAELLRARRVLPGAARA